MQNEYSEDYKHFDNLIWQVPAWCTAIFIGALVVSNGILNSYKEAWGIDLNLLLFPIFFSGSVFLFSFSYVLYRYRVHQIYTENPELPKSASTKFGAQRVLQFSTTFQAAVLLALSIQAILHLYRLTIAVAIATTLIMAYLYETNYNKLQTESKRIKD